MSSEWYASDDFWVKVAPFFMDKEKWAACPEEVAHCARWIGLKKGDPILDLCCGPGRHALEFARQGYRVTGVDHTKPFLTNAGKQAQSENLNIEFVQSDMRSFVRKDSYKGIVNLFSSLAYFEDPDEDVKVLRNVYDSLKSDGVFVLDVLGKEILAKVFQEVRFKEIDGTILLEKAVILDNWNRILVNCSFISKNDRKDFDMSVRVYSARELMDTLNKVGFEKIDIYGDLGGSKYDNNAKRLVAIARK